MLTVLKRTWVLIVVAVAVAFGGVAVDRLRGVFGSDAIFAATGSSADPLEPLHIKRVTYEVYGPGDTAGRVSYLNTDTRSEQANFTGLPWTFTMITTVPTVIANVVAQGDSDRIGCRIIVNDEVKDERTTEGHHAQIACLVKAA
ncbi:MmpS family transport accessory protein [Mycobacterium genavense]|uniref:MmpS family transport accessory protein n=1 Tax=Mycobacterium genavense TaxID=36812 RepID=UPI00046EAD6C|nr:MmpS family transport accessory protein [Mycobacterium genavense]